MSTIDNLTAEELAEVYRQVGEAMFAPGFNLPAHIAANTVDGVFIPPVYVPPEGGAPASNAPDTGGAPLPVPPAEPGTSPVIEDMPLPEFGSAAYRALLLETGRSDLVGFNYPAHLAAKAGKQLDDFDRYLNAGSGAELVNLLGGIDLDDFVVDASSEQVQALVTKFADDPEFAAFLNVQLDKSPPMVRVGTNEISAFELAWTAPREQVPLPAYGSAPYKALLLETGRNDLIGFNYAAHLAAKATSSLEEFDLYLNAEDGSALLALLDAVNVNELMSRASPAQVQALVGKFADDPAFAAYLDNATRPVPPTPGTPAYENLLRQTGRSDLVDFDYDAHLAAVEEATRALSGIGLEAVTEAASIAAGTTRRDKLQAAGDDDALLSAGMGNDVLIGGAGNDVLVGGAGRDVMRGGAGDDIYMVDDLRDRVIETLDGGNDTVIAEIDFRLPNGIETLILSEGDLTATGNAGDNTLVGGSGDNRLDGGAGRDTLTGGAGTDTFVLGGPLARLVPDVVTDFGDDQLLLSKRSFSQLRKGIGEDNFVIGEAADSNDFLVYRDGILFYDPDGSGAKNAIPVIELTGSPTLTLAQILIA